MVRKLTLQGLQSCQGTVDLPGSKSIANRALLMAALGDGTTELNHLLRSDDTARMLEALAALGVGIEELSATCVRVRGCGGRWPKQPEQLYLGNAGTAMRPLTAVLAATSTAPVLLTGDARMQERPIGDLVDALREGGATVRYQQQPGYPPLVLEQALRGGEIHVDGSASSQYISALLMALPLLPNDSHLILTGTVVSWPYIELTLAMLRDFGITVEQHGKQGFSIAGRQRYQSPAAYWIEGDASAASYWLGAGVLGGGPLRIEGIGRKSIQGDIAFIDYLQQMGGRITVHDEYVEVNGGQLRGIDADLNAIPDAAMTFATLALFAKGRTAIRNVANWRIKETDRLHAMATELRKAGAQIEEGADYLIIDPPAQIQHAQIKTYDDHRMAMCFSLLGFSAAGVTIEDPDCCAKTYPDYFSELARVT
ncbi:3-phosphoshikimate 1-carboxyvinyltransferase [Pseudidiomarina sp. 1APR75-15]|uniref:3-phosphoshikimate 1-carboxyvinyltransferase n=1 Tax=Pseudidiomarina terrestris TaxID=2820060 RepID=A0ABT8MEY5_9GAMM|nr:MULTISPECIES: 3-phosphoshikimate 1-carboxyvinyltransferase [unclassified Pseudidiomarina]MDN7127292.1 3-phosphoshikimate 1-carboxyvinyltransferase [Pseudidiomarina sp. 1APR75-33.1]MDN7128482.1 3-phosphoshikimate 1-carboxyvinyltransferase [Pseudidiomarina sp. 1APR75-15]